MMPLMSERIPDLNPDGSITGRVLAVAPDGRLVGVPEGNALKNGWRNATAGDVEAKRKAEAERNAPPKVKAETSKPADK